MSQRVLFERALREENIELAWKMWNAALGNRI